MADNVTAPVAWRYRYRRYVGPDQWRYVEKESDCNPHAEYETQALYISPPVSSKEDWRAAEQGFVDQRGEWLTRKEARMRDEWVKQRDAARSRNASTPPICKDEGHARTIIEGLLMQDGIGQAALIFAVVDLLLEDVAADPSKLKRAMEIARRDIPPYLTPVSATREKEQLFDAVQLSEARAYRDEKSPIGILARAILRANGEMK